MVSQKELLKRSRANQNALGRAFTCLGRVALARVVTGVLPHPRAMRTLAVIRDLWLDKDGDLVNIDNLTQYLRKHKLLKGTTLEWYGGLNHEVGENVN